MKRSIHRLMCSFSILKILPCPPVFIWMTFVQLQNPGGARSSQRRWGQPPRSRTCWPCKSHISQAFMRTSDVSGMSERAYTFFTPKQTQQRCPLFFHLYPKHATSSLLLPPSSLIYILIHSKRDLLWWQRSHFFTLCTVSPCLKFTEAQQVVRYSAKHFIYCTTKFLYGFLYPLDLGISLCVIAGGAFSLQKFFLCLSTHFFRVSGSLLEISNKTILPWFSLRFRKELIVFLK